MEKVHVEINVRIVVFTINMEILKGKSNGSCHSVWEALEK